MDVLYELPEHIRLKLLNNDRLVLLNWYLNKHFLITAPMEPKHFIKIYECIYAEFTVKTPF